MTSRRKFLLAAATLPFIPLSAHALTQGKEYALVQPALATQDPKRVEVLEFFWYGCPHCFTLEPDLAAWVKTLPKGAYFRRIPAVFNPSWAHLARAYYAAEGLGVTEKLHYDIFNAIHLSGQNLNNRETLLSFVEKLGVNRKKFAQQLDSPEVTARVEMSQRLGAAAKLQGVPALVVDGKYQTSVSQTGGQDQLFVVLNELIALAQTGKKR
ncbi:MAG: thiol:disulfide interchange protein DsbA/DsbL [Burkholderiales bacterium]|nr:thiol:disulfide interchange protein DsbA/DsbL [Burkholderiales bacterium]